MDFWEDYSRRHRRFVPNPYGSSHRLATFNYHPNGNKKTKQTDQQKDEIHDPNNILNKIKLNLIDEDGETSSKSEKLLDDVDGIGETKKNETDGFYPFVINKFDLSGISVYPHYDPFHANRLDIGCKGWFGIFCKICKHVY